MQAGRISLPTYFSQQNELESPEGRAGHGFSEHPNYLRFDVLHRARREVAVEAYLVTGNSNVSVPGVPLGRRPVRRRDGA